MIFWVLVYGVVVIVWAFARAVVMLLFLIFWAIASVIATVGLVVTGQYRRKS